MKDSSFENTDTKNIIVKLDLHLKALLLFKVMQT